MFHEQVIGAYSRNLDLFFSSADQVRRLVADSASRSDITVIEGVMGYYDGIAVSDEASAWDVARTTETPAVFLVDGRGRAHSIAAEVAGFAQYHDESFIKGVVLNRVSGALYPRLKELIEERTGITVYGYLPKLDDCSLESRHLGLVTANEVVDLREKLDRLASVMEETVDIDGLIALASNAPLLGDCNWQGIESERYDEAPRIAIARDDAFCFYYADALRLLEHLGAELVAFSPLEDENLPQGVSGLYLGGGYPELHARELNENESMLRSIAVAMASGMPTIAECGGFMYLHELLEDKNDGVYRQVGVFEGKSYRTPRLGRFGYIDLTAQRSGLLADVDERMRAHEFHYWDSENPGNAFFAVKPQSSRSWTCGFSTPSMYAGYPHLYLPASPRAAQRFVQACADYAVKSFASEAEGQGGAR
jgi:cobyrinic acid a,c-diamide synthase